MADAAIFVGFGQPARAREPQALELFNQTVRYYSELQERGEIESFEPVILEPHGGDLGGFFLLRGERAKLDRVRASEEFMRISTRAGLVVESFGVVMGFTGDGLAAQMSRYEQQVREQLES